ncbi:MAG: AraC family transcriptional regulator CmrA [Hyphomicrobiales bacterium]|nr:MAG: AraC family transcriptional regulator CmrA [Hyphomicrobiales bacterium]
MNIQQHELASIIDQYAVVEGLNQTIIPQVSLLKISTPDIPVPCIYQPCICFIAQGQKQVMLENHHYRYSPSEYLIISVELPLMSQILKASESEPYLMLKIDIDLQQLSELLILIGHPADLNKKTQRGIFVGKSDAAMADSVLRLARLLSTPDDIPVLAGQTMREIYYRLLQSDYGAMVAQTALKGSHMQNISLAIQKIKSEFETHISIDKLAGLSGMSISSFHAHFKAVTAMSPLQFQKSIRLIEARNLMLVNELDAASTAYKVGYESPSQFNREYARMFGKPPMQDISNLLSNQGK